MNVGWLPKLCDVFHRIVCLKSLLEIMNEILHKGAMPFSWHKTLFQMLPTKLTVLASQLIFGPLQTYAYSTKSLLHWCLVGLRRRWNNTSLMNSMDSGAVGGVKVKAWTPCGGPILGAGGEPKETIFTNPYLQIASL